jgi:predicted amidophosphoribosyltransferase
MPAALTPLIDMAFPPRCPLCGDPLSEQGGLCPACWQRLAIPGEPACGLCQRPLGDTGAGSAGPLVCAPCLAEKPRHDGITAATLYTDASRSLVLALKHGRRISLAGLLGRLVAARLTGLEGEWLAIPVPLHRWRLWHRGFNQSALIAREVANSARARLVVDGLLRPRATPALGGFGRAERARVLKGSIVANPRRAQDLHDSRVLLVDDVMTSGATTDACIAALRKAGVREVRIACFARVLDEALPHV